MNFPFEISPEEQKVIEELKKRMLPHVTPKMLEDPFLFYRFSKARNFNLKQAEAMLKKHIAWRQEFGIDTILTDFTACEVIRKYGPISKVGFDKEGHPVRYVSISGADNIGLFKSTTKNELLKYYFQCHEEDMLLLKKQSQKLGRPITKVLHIYDFKKLSFTQATHKQSIDLLITAVTMYQDNYPERAKAIYVLNTSFYFGLLYSVVKVFMAAAVIDKIKFFGTAGWKASLLEVIDADVLPAFLGGNRTDPDGNPLCKSFVVHGGSVPEHYYIEKSKKTLHQEPGVKKLNITRFSSAHISFDVTEPDSILEWEFETKSKDIGFGLYFKDVSCNNSKLVELVPKQRYNTSIEPEAGMFKCEKPGTYIIMFDNSYSWIYQKEIYYRSAILPPSHQEKQQKIM